MTRHRKSSAPLRASAERRAPRPTGKSADTAAIIMGLRRIVKALHSYSREVERRFGLTGPQLWALKTLLRGEGMTIGQLAEALAVHQTSASLLLQRLVKRGLVQRSRNQHDRRSVELRLTARGRRVAAKAPEAAQGRLLHALSAAPAAEVRRLRRSVDRLVEAMEATGVEAPFFFGDGQISRSGRGKA